MIRGLRAPFRHFALLASFASILAATSACVTSRITVEASGDESLAAAKTVLVALLPTDTQARARAGQEPSAETANALRARIEEALLARGYAAAADDAGDLVLEIAPRVEHVSRRTWSSDPDASAPRLVSGTDLVLALRGRDREDFTLWSCEARAPLPESRRDEAEPGANDALWRELALRAIEKIPAQRPRG